MTVSFERITVKLLSADFELLSSQNVSVLTYNKMPNIIEPGFIKSTDLALLSKSGHRK